MRVDPDHLPANADTPEAKWDLLTQIQTQLLSHRDEFVEETLGECEAVRMRHIEAWPMHWNGEKTDQQQRRKEEGWMVVVALVIYSKCDFLGQ